MTSERDQLQATCDSPGLDIRLSRPAEQIRLIKLYENSGGQIECKLDVFEFRDAPGFTALSYLWGPELPAFEIQVNGQPFSIRKNLYLFLQEILKAENSTRQYIWTDQICIKQYDIDEKNHQVKLMSSIYRDAASVLVWLGEPTEKRIGLAKQFDQITTRSSLSSIKAVEALLEEEYCTRVWIKQEVLLNKNASILISANENQIQWNLVHAIVAARSRTHTFDAKFKNAWGLVLIAPDRFPAQLATCLQLFSESKCSDPRDKIYGMLSLCHETYWPEVSYGKSLQQVFLETVLMLYRVAYAVTRQHSSSCWISLMEWRLMEVACETLGSTLGSHGDRFSLLAFAEKIAQWGFEQREEIITEMGWELNKNKIIELGMDPTLPYGGGRWWFKAGHEIYWDVADEQIKARLEKSGIMHQPTEILVPSRKYSKLFSAFVRNPDTVKNVDEKLAKSVLSVHEPCVDILNRDAEQVGEVWNGTYENALEVLGFEGHI